MPDGNFWRIRLGIGRPEEKEAKGVEEYVVGNFTHQEHAKVRELIPHAAKAIEDALEEGLDIAMNRYNTK
jgi:peptidyl-tRNA hydrolase